MRRRHVLSICTVVCVVLAGSFSVQGAFAQEVRSSTRLTNEHYLDWERVSDAQISPDGRRIIYTRQSVNQIDDKWDSALVQSASSGDSFKTVAGLFGTLVLRLQQIDVPALRDIERMSSSTVQTATVALQREAAVADGA